MISYLPLDGICVVFPSSVIESQGVPGRLESPSQRHEANRLQKPRFVRSNLFSLLSSSYLSHISLYSTLPRSAHHPPFNLTFYLFRNALRPLRLFRRHLRCCRRCQPQPRARAQPFPRSMRRSKLRCLPSPSNLSTWSSSRSIPMQSPCVSSSFYSTCTAPRRDADCLYIRIDSPVGSRRPSVKRAAFCEEGAVACPVVGTLHGFECINIKVSIYRLPFSLVSKRLRREMRSSSPRYPFELR
jgi:hypothetical protein